MQIQDTLVKVDGLQFKSYQMNWIETIAKLDGLSVNEWIECKVLSILQSHLGIFTDYTKPACEKLEADL